MQMWSTIQIITLLHNPEVNTSTEWNTDMWAAVGNTDCAMERCNKRHTKLGGRKYRI